MKNRVHRQKEFGYVRHIACCHHKDHTSCSVSKGYYPFTDNCPMNGHSHNDEHFKCGYYDKNGCCSNIETQDIFMRIFHVNDHYYIPDGIDFSVMHVSLFGTYDKKWKIEINLGDNYDITEEVCKKLKLKRERYFTKFDYDGIRLYCDKIKSLEKEIIKLTKELSTCMKCGAVAFPIGIHGNNRFCNSCKEDILESSGYVQRKKVG